MGGVAHLNFALKIMSAQQSIFWPKKVVLSFFPKILQMAARYVADVMFVNYWFYIFKWNLLLSFFPYYLEYCLIYRWRAIFFTETAVSNYTGHTKFYTDGEKNEKHEWGAGIVKDNKNLMQNSSGEREWWFHWDKDRKYHIIV